QSVSRTLDSMSGIRETARVTGKRLKRLGERTQEISRIIDIIGNIAERTTVLALNASMQANAAGEAGRGFSLIAEEIQHLSENARESTDQINVLVRNIQQEANTTITTMDETIAEVVEGSARAEEAAQQMETTLEATGQLVHSVGQIASDSGQQVAVSRELQSRAGRILEATEKTGSELSSLTRLTRQMAEYGQQLVRSVSVFRLEP
ncbi:MAG TPA: methyl-accepting chemotaxis protein, partial [Thiolinea sp.]|nr:methyl-accepting chemotaxis protein [Thiolinea sp.]